MPTPDLPTPNWYSYLMRHMTVAIFKTLGGDEQQRFIGAFNIARAQLARYGYNTEDSEHGPLRKIRMSSKGRKYDRKHQIEGARKNAMFARLYEKYKGALAFDATLLPHEKVRSPRAENPPPKKAPRRPATAAQARAYIKKRIQIERKAAEKKLAQRKAAAKKLSAKKAKTAKKIQVKRPKKPKVLKPRVR